MGAKATVLSAATRRARGFPQIELRGPVKEHLLREIGLPFDENAPPPQTALEEPSIGLDKTIVRSRFQKDGARRMQHLSLLRSVKKLRSITASLPRLLLHGNGEITGCLNHACTAFLSTGTHPIRTETSRPGRGRLRLVPTNGSRKASAALSSTWKLAVALLKESTEPPNSPRGCLPLNSSRSEQPHTFLYPPQPVPIGTQPCSSTLPSRAACRSRREQRREWLELPTAAGSANSQPPACRTRRRAARHEMHLEPKHAGDSTLNTLGAPSRSREGEVKTDGTA